MITEEQNSVIELGFSLHRLRQPLLKTRTLRLPTKIFASPLRLTTTVQSPGQSLEAQFLLGLIDVQNLCLITVNETLFARLLRDEGRDLAPLVLSVLGEEIVDVDVVPFCLAGADDWSEAFLQCGLGQAWNLSTSLVGRSTASSIDSGRAHNGNLYSFWILGGLFKHDLVDIAMEGSVGQRCHLVNPLQVVREWKLTNDDISFGGSLLDDFVVIQRTDGQLHIGILLLHSLALVLTSD
ncbi:hypothetical protein HG530_008153 [Fusarium avenaceum]|nr:hypothetical protein HG530_008153 [Fusarium avenaceum]